MPCSRLACVFAVLVFAVCTSAATSDEALLKDGRSIQGKLSQTDTGSLQFISGSRNVPLGDIDRVSLSGNITPFRAGTLHQVTLTNDQWLCGEIVALDAQVLRLRTSWNNNLLIPR